MSKKDLSFGAKGARINKQGLAKWESDFLGIEINEGLIRDAVVTTRMSSAAALVQYPSPKALFEMGLTPEYQQAHKHRKAGLERTVLTRARRPLS